MDLGQADIDHLERQTELLERTAAAMERIGNQVDRLGSGGLMHVEVTAVGEVMACKAYFKEAVQGAMEEPDPRDAYERPRHMGQRAE